MKILNAIKKCWCIEQITQTFDLLDTGVLNLQILTLFFFTKLPASWVGLSFRSYPNWTKFFPIYLRSLLSVVKELICESEHIFSCY